MNATYAMLENHLWQSTLFAAAAWLLTLTLRSNRARVRHAVWLAASLKFLVPFSVLIALGSQIEWRTAPAVTTPADFAIVMGEVSQPFSSVTLAPLPAAIPRATNPWPAVLLAIWALGFLGIACSWMVRWRRVQVSMQAGAPLQLEIPIRAISSPTLLEPGVFGICRPVLLLPKGIRERLTPAQLQSVIDHELCHVRHRDNLVAAIQMFIETVFWFHPLVWWIGKRMVAERERACDEAVLGLGSEPHVYAEAILNVCKLYVESPLACVAGVTGAGLKQRIEAIIKNRMGANLNRTKKVLLAAAAVVAIAAPIAIGIMNSPPLHAQPAANASAPKWEVASIKPCNDEPGGRSGKGGPAPGRLNINCQTVMNLLEAAYGFYSNGRGPSWNHFSFEGAPAWLNSERYTIVAKSETPQGHAMMRGPMMQALLEDRFKLKIRREIREVPVYNLTVAKGGPKNLPVTKPGSCIPLDLDHLPAPEPGKDLPEICGMFGRRRVSEGERRFIDPGVTMTTFADGISAMLDRNVIDKTGLSGRFDIDVQVSIPDAPPRDSSTQEERAGDERDLVFAVIQKLGLKLESAKGPGIVYVIESIQRPTDNFEPPPQAPPIAAKPQRSPAPVAETSLRFEVASIKPGPPGAIGPTIYNPTRERFAVESITTKALIAYAYDVREFQISGGPGWLGSEEYTIVARPEGDAGRERILAMVRNLLAERFHLTVHHESKEMPVLDLVIAKGGPKLQPSAGTGGPEVRGGRGRLIARNVTMEMLASQLAGRVLVRPVLDRTGVPGKFDINLEWTLSESSDTGPSIFTALEEQLGLELETRKGPVDMLVIHHVEKPSEN